MATRSIVTASIRHINFAAGGGTTAVKPLRPLKVCRDCAKLEQRWAVSLAGA